jgi:hypothetical protein
MWGDIVIFSEDSILLREIFSFGSVCYLVEEFCYGVYNQCDSFIYLDLIIKNMYITIERYFKWDQYQISVGHVSKLLIY